ncbi:hypothetical protein Bpfe_008262 [Biomphalaria pfeifferi]|uniref:Uncharacterized protein n=1 Tax=Biomphalaria pfeifferi TaxID=112525 RepID=A0AAD8BWX0_BIOPF|nr:hypothetical protein Bpfe_008262 [Biomphalaria pfeifferi]
MSSTIKNKELRTEAHTLRPDSRHGTEAHTLRPGRQPSWDSSPYPTTRQVAVMGQKPIPYDQAGMRHGTEAHTLRPGRQPSWDRSPYPTTRQAAVMGSD